MKFCIVFLAISVVLLGLVLINNKERFAPGNKTEHGDVLQYKSTEQTDVTSQHRKTIGFNFSSPNWNFGGPFSVEKV
jgi:hypothetical protein